MKSNELNQRSTDGGGDGLRRWEAPGPEAFRDAFPGLRVIALAGKGGMGAVYRAEQSRLGRDVAVKVLPPQAAPGREARERFEREARILSGLNHPHILQIYDFGSLADGTLYLVTEWAERGDLAGLIGEKPHPPSEVRSWVRQIGQALDAAHARGIVHRDLKPGNVLVRADGRLALADFGLAHSLGAGFVPGITLPGHLFGTFEYMAPEQMEQEPRITPACDLYALGVMTYQMLTGRVPRGAYTRPSRLVAVPGDVDSFLDLAMASDPERRPKSGAEYAQLFDRACRSRDRRRQRQLIGLGVTLVVLALAWARAEIIRAERESAAAEARQLALVADARLNDARRALAAARRAAEETRAETAAEVRAPGGWSSLIATVDLDRATPAGAWRRRDGELVSGGGRAVLALEAPLAVNYDLALEFTRGSGHGPVALFLPTQSGVGNLEFDTEPGLAGLRVVDGMEPRRSGASFAAKVENGQRHRVLVMVRGRHVTVEWEGEPALSIGLAEKRLRLAPNWDIKREIAFGVGAYDPITVHRVAYRIWPADGEP